MTYSARPVIQLAKRQVGVTYDSDVVALTVVSIDTPGGEVVYAYNGTGNPLGDTYAALEFVVVNDDAHVGDAGYLATVDLLVSADGTADDENDRWQATCMPGAQAIIRVPNVQAVDGITIPRWYKLRVTTPSPGYPTISIRYGIGGRKRLP